MSKDYEGNMDMRGGGHRHPFNNGSEKRITHGPGGNATKRYTERPGPATDACTSSGKPSGDRGDDY